MRFRARSWTFVPGLAVTTKIALILASLPGGRAYCQLAPPPQGGPGIETPSTSLSNSIKEKLKERLIVQQSLTSCAGKAYGAAKEARSWMSILLAEARSEISKSPDEAGNNAARGAIPGARPPLTPAPGAVPNVPTAAAIVPGAAAPPARKRGLTKAGIITTLMEVAEGELKQAKVELLRARDAEGWALEHFRRGFVSKTMTSVAAHRVEFAKAQADRAAMKKSAAEYLESDQAIQLLLAALDKAQAAETAAEEAWKREIMQERQIETEVAVATLAVDDPPILPRPAHLDDEHRITLFSALEGQSIILFLVPNGSEVKRGQLICQLDPSPLRSQITDRQTKAAVAEADFHNARLQRENAEAALQEYRNTLSLLSREETEGEIDLAEAEVALAEARRDSRLTAGELARNKPLEAEVEVSRARLNLQKARNRKVRRDINHDRQIRSLHQAIEKSVGEEIAKKKVLEYDLAMVERLARQIDQARILAPVDGKIVYRSELPIRTGDLVRWGQMLFQIVPVKATPSQSTRP
jgi:hypothetical protein